MKGARDPGPVFIVGAGKAGTSLACALRDAGFPVLLVLRHAPARNLPVPFRHLDSLAFPGTRPTVVVLAVPDRCLRETADRIVLQAEPGSRLVLGHLSGVLPSSGLAPGFPDRVAGRFSAHPLFAFPPPDPPLPIPGGVPFLVEGDEAGIAIAQALVLAIEGMPIPIDPARKPLAHGAAVLAANLPAELVFCAADVFRDLGVPDPQRVAARLFRSLSDNLENQPSPSALTGPLARGDAGTVKANLAALRQWAGRSRDIPSLYRRLSSMLAARMRRTGLPGPASAWKRLREVLR